MTDAKAEAQAPPPPAVPVPKVNEAPLVPAGPTTLEGTANAVTGDAIRIGDSLVRLYGIAAPDLAANFGPQARAVLDTLVDGQRVSCMVYDKTADGDAIGACKQGANDPAEALLGQGLAAVYRRGNPADATQQALATRYDAAESLARQQGIGLWEKLHQPAGARPEEIASGQLRAFAAYALLLIAIFTIPITQVSIWRSGRKDRERLRHARRTALASGLAAEIEIISAAARQNLDHIGAFPLDRPVPGGVSTGLGLPSAPFWHANAERLYVLPVEVTIPLLRFHALHEDAVRRLAIASALPNLAVAEALNAVTTAAAQAVTAIEQALGLAKRDASKVTEPPQAESNPTPA